MKKWLDDNPKGLHGKHEYRLEDYSITGADVEKLFAGYADKYDLSMG